jgi:prophage regulatory protein
MRDLTSDYGLSPATVYRWISEGSFPQPIRLGRNSVAWKGEEIEEWVRSRPRADIRQTG